MDIIDAHHHVGSLSESMGAFAEKTPVDATDYARFELDTRLAIMDAQDVRQAVMIAGHGYLRPDGIADTRRVNDGVVAYAADLPDRFPATVGIVEPLYGERGFEEIARCKELGMVGISFHTRFQGVSTDSPWVHRYIERMGEIGLVPFVHTFGDSADEALWKVDALAGDFPDLTILVMDTYSNFEQPRFAVHMARRRPNTLFDTAAAYSFDFFRPLIDAVGAERVVYGSDVYSWPITKTPTHILPQILESDLTSAEKQLIVGENLRRLLGLPTPTATDGH